MDPEALCGGIEGCGCLQFVEGPSDDVDRMPG